jgi:hypothetical protein
MQEKLGLNIVLFKIKDSTFDLSTYGLTDRYFRMDVTKNISSSKSVKFTEYPLVDGTTRIDTVSRAPGTLNFQGEIGELFSSPNYTHSIKTSLNGGKSRIELSIELLETLRDEAIVLDVLTEGKTFYNYLIESVNFTFEKFGVSTVNFTLKEFIAFEDQFEGIEEETTVDSSLTNDLFLRNLVVDDFKTEEEMAQVIYNTISDTNASAGFAIRFGSSDINPDVFIRPITVSNIPYLQRVTTGRGVGVVTTRTYMPTVVKSKLDMQILTSGAVKGNLQVKIEIDQIEEGNFTNDDDLNVGPLEPVFSETPKYNVRITLFTVSQGENVVLDNIMTNDFMISPKFSNVDRCFNPLENKATFENDPIITYGNVPGRLFATSFLRKFKGFLGIIEYKAVPNLLQHADQGYLYPTFYYSRIPRSSDYRLNIGFVYLHPEFAYKIKERIIENAKNSDNLLYARRITWW